MYKEYVKRLQLQQGVHGIRENGTEAVSDMQTSKQASNGHTAVGAKDANYVKQANGPVQAKTAATSERYVTTWDK